METSNLTRKIANSQTLLHVRVKTRASCNSVTGLANGFLCVSTTSVPENNKANKCIINLLSDFMSIPKTSICIHKGHSVRDKVFLIDAEITDDFILQKLKVKNDNGR